MSAPPPLSGTTQLGSFYLTNPLANPSTLNPAYYGESGGFGYPVGSQITISVTSSTGSGADSRAFLSTVAGSVITNVQVQQAYVDRGGTGTGYKLGDRLVFTAATGQGAIGLVNGISSSGAITSITLAPNGIVGQLLFSISGASYPPIYYTSGGSTFAANGIVGAFSTEVSGYYNNANALETNLEDLTTALNKISGTSSDYAGTSTVMSTGTLLWYTSNSAGVYTSTVVPANTTIYNFLKNYAYTTLNTSIGGTSEQQVNIQAINAAIAPVQNNLQTQQAFLNSAVSTLQTQISQFSQVINQYFSAMQGAANAIG